MDSLPWPPTEAAIDALSDDDLRLLDSVVRSAIAKRRWAKSDAASKRRQTEAARTAAQALSAEQRRAQTAKATAARQANRERARREAGG